jgi:hypothetical protein
MPTNKKPQQSPTAFFKEVGILLGAGALTFFVIENLRETLSLQRREG